MQAVLEWARQEGHAEARLWVTADNGPAEGLYPRHGFVRTGESQPVTPGDLMRREIAMVCALDATRTRHMLQPSPNRP